MPVLERDELEASPLADLHAIADQVGLEGFRRLRKADLIDAILGEKSPSPSSGGDDDGEERPKARRRRAPRARRGKAEADADEQATDASARDAEEPDEDEDEADAKPKARSRGTRGGRSRGSRGGAAAAASAGGRRGGAKGSDDEQGEPEIDASAKTAKGVVEVLGNGSAFLRVDPPEPSDEDVYISAAQVRRCELVSGDEVSGPVRTPRRSERYPSLVRVDTINGASADSVSDGVRYDDQPVAWPKDRLELKSDDKTLEAIDALTPLGKGSRVTIVGPRHAGKSETLRRIVAAFAGRDGLELKLALVGVRPEEVAEWQDGPVEPACALTFAAAPDAQAQAVERVLDAAKRTAARGGDALVLIDCLDGLQPQAARRLLAAGRNLKDAGSLTIVAIATQPLGGETTVIALDAALTSTGRAPILDLANSGTLKPELLVGKTGAKEIAKARASVLDAG
ncbi:MAG TPA: Rho termination factor N-terminal domain-containing protein [Solirubrobacteraceae bacterium]|jgi:transcription termination factor Rho